jgi:hypothetical protein
VLKLQARNSALVAEEAEVCAHRVAVDNEITKLQQAAATQAAAGCRHASCSAEGAYSVTNTLWQFFFVLKATRYMRKQRERCYAC